MMLKKEQKKREKDKVVVGINMAKGGEEKHDYKKKEQKRGTCLGEREGVVLISSSRSVLLGPAS